MQIAAGLATLVVTAQTTPAQMPPGLYLREGAGPAGQESEDLLVAVVAH
jgi:hypothetical protein